MRATERLSVILLAATLALPMPAVAADRPAPVVVAERIASGPVIGPGMKGLEGEAGANIGDPAVLRGPDWVANPLGRYYMYFAHHRGDTIRLAYADRPEGPWTIHEPGTLRLEQTSAIHHIASPDVLVDHAERRILLYVHGPVETPDLDYGGRPYAQRSFVAASDDGTSFRAISGAIAPPYMKVFRHEGSVYGLAMADKASAYPAWLRSGQFVRSFDGTTSFTKGPRILDEMRHAAVLKRGETLHVFYTRVGDRPERIYHATVDLRPDWREWTAAAPTELLAPERAYEGSDLPLHASAGGMARGRERALRDPAVLVDGDAVYLYYAIAGENGIAAARLLFAGDAQ